MKISVRLNESDRLAHIFQSTHGPSGELFWKSFRFIWNFQFFKWPKIFQLSRAIERVLTRNRKIKGTGQNRLIFSHMWKRCFYTTENKYAYISALERLSVFFTTYSFPWSSTNVSYASTPVNTTSLTDVHTHNKTKGKTSYTYC